MELLTSYIEILRDPSVPSHRIVRKTTSLCLIAICLLFYYRHFTLELETETAESLLVTLILALGGFIFIEIVGGLLSGSFYESFLKDVGAHQAESSLNVFFAERLFAVLPLGVITFSLCLQ